MNLRFIYIKLIPLKIRELVLPLFISDYWLIITDLKLFLLKQKIKTRIILHYTHYKNEHQENVKAFNFCIKNGFSMFPGEYSLKYKYNKVKVTKDTNCGLLYVMHNEKRLYFKRSIIREEICALLYSNLLLDQDAESPHRYIDSEFNLEEQSILFDIGAAEGIFTLDNIEKIKQAYLFECDEEWIEALRNTFAPWQDKVSIVKRYVSSQDNDKEISIDYYTRKQNIFPDFIKMDIEGAEFDALNGAKELLKNDKKLKLSICTYHRHCDAIKISDFLRKRNFEISFTKGVLLIIHRIFSKDIEPPFFRKGVIRATKNNGN